MAWCHKLGNEWVKINDEFQKNKSNKDLQKLKGGLPSSQMGYLLLYRRIDA